MEQKQRNSNCVCRNEERIRSEIDVIPLVTTICLAEVVRLSLRPTQVLFLLLTHIKNQREILDVMMMVHLPIMVMIFWITQFQRELHQTYLQRDLFQAQL